MKRICLLIIFLSFKFSYGYINIYPIKFDKNITNGATENFRLYNRTGNEKRYRVYLENNSDNDMSQWIEIYPRSISLKPYEKKELRLAITPPNDAVPGKYRTTLIIKEVNLPTIKEEKKIKFMTLFKMNMTGYIEK